VLEKRFGPLPDSIEADLSREDDLARLRNLHAEAVVCRDLSAFRELLARSPAGRR